MNLGFDPELYSQSHHPSEEVLEFIIDTLPYLGWGIRLYNVVMDVGCGDGQVTKDLILPLFPNSKKVHAFDVLPKMIDVAKEKNSHPEIEYTIADIEDWSTLQQWNGQIAKLISIDCFHWLKDQRLAFQNTFRLLETYGKAAFVFFLEATFFTAVLELEKSLKWSQFFNGIDNHVPVSHLNKYDKSYYQNLLEEVGFEIIHIAEIPFEDIMDSDEDYINFFTSICVLVQHIPAYKKEEFRRDLFQELLELNGRSRNGFPFHRGKIIEIAVQKFRS